MNTALVSPARTTQWYRSADLLGGASKVVPAGTVVRLPAAPNSLDWSGFNTLSLKATVAGLAGADSLVIAADTLDPESAAGALLAGSLGRSTVITATSNGNKAGTLWLRNVLGGSMAPLVPAQTLLPVAKLWQGGWGVAGAGGDQSVACQTNDGNTSFIQGSDTTPGIASSLGMALPLDPGVYTGWTLNVVATKLSGSGSHPVIGVDCLLGERISYSTPGTGGGVFGGSASAIFLGWLGRASSIPGGNYVLPTPVGPLDYAWTTYSFALTSAQAQAIVAIASNHYLIFQPMTRSNTGDPGVADTYPNITQVYISAPASGPSGPPGLTEEAIPFYRNALVLDATGSAHDVTVTSLLAELTKTQRRR